MSGVRGCDRRNRQIQIGRFSKQRCVNGWPLVQLQMKAGSNKIGAAHHPRERAAPISVNAPPVPRGRGRDNTYKELRPVSGHKYCLSLNS